MKEIAASKTAHLSWEKIKRGLYIFCVAGFVLSVLGGLGGCTYDPKNPHSLFALLNCHREFNAADRELDNIVPEYCQVKPWVKNSDGLLTIIKYLKDSGHVSASDAKIIAKKLNMEKILSNNISRSNVKNIQYFRLEKPVWINSHIYGRSKLLLASSSDIQIAQAQFLPYITEITEPVIDEIDTGASEFAASAEEMFAYLRLSAVNLQTVLQYAYKELPYAPAVTMSMIDKVRDRWCSANQCDTVMVRGNGGGGAAQGGGDEDCDVLNARDTSICNAITRTKGAEAGQICHASASVRYANCLVGKPLPPLTVRY